MVTPQQRRLAGPSYIACAGLILFPIIDQMMQLVPTAKLHDARWRFGAAGLMSNLFVLPLIGLMLLFILSSAFEHRVFQRILAVLCAVAALVLLIATGLFMLDAVQVRSLMNPLAMKSWAVASSTAVLKLLVTIVCSAWFAYVGFRMSKPPKAAQRSSGLVMGGAKPKGVTPGTGTASEA